MGDMVLQRIPVESCSQTFNMSMVEDLPANETSMDGVTEEQALGDDDVTYKCYRFAFNYAEGIGAAGGILFFTVILSKLYISIFVSFYKLDNSVVGLGSAIALWIVTPLLWVAFILVNTTVPLVRDVVFQTATDGIQFVLYAANFGVVCVFGGYVISIGIIRANN